MQEFEQRSISRRRMFRDLIVGTSSLAVGATGLATGRPPEEIVKADKYFNSGNKARKANKYLAVSGTFTNLFTLSGNRRAIINGALAGSLSIIFEI